MGGSGTLYYRAVEVPMESFREMWSEKSRRLAGLGSMSLCCSLMFLLLAGALPMWIVGSLRGSAKVGFFVVNVDFNIGTGIFLKHACWGGSTPEEDDLNKLGLSCNGESVLQGCDRDNLSGSEEDTCKRLKAAEGCAVLSVIVAFFGLLFGCCSGSGSKARATIAAVLSGLTMVLAVVVLGVVEDSALIKDQKFGCDNVLGAEICWRPGPSHGLQAMGILSSIIAIVCFSMVSSRAQAVYAGQPLLAWEV